MRQEIRFFLFVAVPGKPCEVEAFRDSASAREKWLSLLEANSATAGMMFAGSSRIGIHEIESMMSGWRGLLLISESCRWLLPPEWTTFDIAVEGMPASPQSREMGLYLGKSGWGYSEDKAAEAMSVLQIAPDVEAAKTGVWSIARDQEGFLAALSILGESDPFLIARHLPDWALEVPFDYLPLTVRCRNVLLKQRIIRLVDLGKYVLEEAMQWQNFGRYSVEDLAETLVSFLRDGPIQLASEQELPNVLDLPPLIECIRLSTRAMEAREASVWKSRIGLDGPRMTLEQLATLHGITRERVRQIEAKTLRNYRQMNRWIDALGPRIEQVLQKQESVLFLDDIELQDQWFLGISEQPTLLGTLFEYFGPTELHVWGISGRALVARIDEQEWTLVKRTLLETLRVAAEDRVAFQDVELMTKSALGTKGASLTSLLLMELNPYLRFSEGANNDRRLLSVGRGLTAEVRAAIQDADGPLHYSEVAALCETALGRTVNQQQIINTLASFDDTVHFGRGTYGLRRHFPISNTDCDEILRLADEIVLTEPNLRQWHSDEILAQIQILNSNLARNLDKYLMSSILSTSQSIAPMGRMVWIAKKYEGDLPRRRIEIQDACIRLLRDAGRPLDNRELRDQLSSIRGMSPFFMLSPNEQIARVSPGVWGLVSRDFASTECQRERVLDHLHSVLVERNSPIHMEALCTEIFDESPLPEGMTPYMVMNLAQSDRRMHVYRGRYIGLVNWDLLVNEIPEADVSNNPLPLDLGETEATDFTDF